MTNVVFLWYANNDDHVGVRNTAVLALNFGDATLLLLRRVRNRSATNQL